MQFLERFREPSSWAAISVLLTLAGVNVQGAELIAQAGAALAAAFGFFLKEKGAK